AQGLRGVGAHHHGRQVQDAQARERAGGSGRSAHCFWIPASSISFFHLPSSATVKLPSSSGVLPKASKPSCDTRSRKAALLAVPASARLSAPTTSRGVPAGANTPFHEVMSKPFSSGVSATGGSSLKSLVRSLVVTAMARILPALT